jgi:hypothetical protein
MMKYIPKWMKHYELDHKDVIGDMGEIIPMDEL